MSHSVVTTRLRRLINLAKSSTGGSRFILPRPAKWLFLLVWLLNVRSWPGAWHARVLSLIAWIRFMEILDKVDGAFMRLIYPKERSLESQTRACAVTAYMRICRLLNWSTSDKAWWTSVSPVGRTPFPTPHAQGPNQAVQIVAKLWATPDDCDWNGHLSNSSYGKNLDPVGMRVYFAAKFVTLPASKKAPKSLEPAPEISSAPAKLSLKTHDTDGALIHCIAVPMMCFKHGRVTVPPKIALAVSGFSLSEAGSKKNWELANAIRARGTGAMNGYLRGGWKQGEKWWEPSAEVESERARRVDILGKLMKGMDGLRM
ncbi:hypothetical protein BDV93DRAFT_507482 [Ceratobasidium sp. AG-I]|nr:hypothetical protein BDV93DRAFT_507482 [Ceratobasidium sp. AG-I]